MAPNVNRKTRTSDLAPGTGSVTNRIPFGNVWSSGVKIEGSWKEERYKKKRYEKGRYKKRRYRNIDKQNQSVASGFSHTTDRFALRDWKGADGVATKAKP